MIYKFFLFFLFLFNSFYSFTKYLNLTLKAGLNNQKIMILAGLKMCLDENLVLIEPYFTNFLVKNDQPILFSEIFDFDFFSKMINSYIKTISYKEYIALDNPCVVNVNGGELARQMKENHKIEKLYLRALRLNKKNLLLADRFLEKLGQNYIAIHTRIESDWLGYSKHKQVPSYEKIYFSKEEIFNKFLNSKLNIFKNIYLATFYEKNDLISLWSNAGYTPYIFPSNGKNYHLSSAIDFEICVRSKKFIGHTRSTFSNNVVKTRSILGKMDNYLYNSNDNLLHLRYDLGRYSDVKLAIESEDKVT